MAPRVYIYISRRDVENSVNQPTRVSRADHRGEPTALACRIGCSLGEGSNALAPGEAHRAASASAPIRSSSSPTVSESIPAALSAEPMRARHSRGATAHRRGSGRRRGRRHNRAPRNARPAHRPWRIRFRPAALAQLAAKIGRSLARVVA